ncbi:hypothetical protein SAMN04489835_3472 [Mycolicibacterium rutilum]|uniref:Uncharacterized protein n=2 Tax=Mycolicibacterium rutilum TaxID=370526 RepID=A0A1H6KK05_MYCRU|nr:hypothetical protein SAMN04489835_3472 [Mycolicibacterium rutilum]
MSFAKTQPWNWVDLERHITPDFQLFGFRPTDETGTPSPCQGCGVNPPTAYVKVYAPGRFDPATVRSGQPVDVDGRAGFFRPFGENTAPEPDGFRDATLTWEYADDAWATARGLTPVTAGRDRLLELARALRPDERTAVRAPLRLGAVPPQLPLVHVHTTYQPIYSPDSDVGTVLGFGPCVTLTKEQKCRDEAAPTGSLSVRILDRDEFTDGSHRAEVDRAIGGRAGRYDGSLFWAAILLAPGVYVQFDMDPPGESRSTETFERVLNSVAWAPDPGTQADWPPITDWVG